MYVVTVKIPDVPSYSAFCTELVSIPTATVNVSLFLSSADVIIPVYFLGPTPSAIIPKLPKDEFEFVTSHCPPL